MLYFRIRPEPTFLRTLHRALESELHEITRISREQAVDDWEAGFGQISQHFTPYSAIVTLEQLLIASQTVRVYRLSDYHWLLLYECLKNYCAVHQDDTMPDEGQRLTREEYRLKSIDFHAMIDLYFWDTDFLLLSNLEQTPIPCHECSGSPDVSMAQLTIGLEPHPIHLQLTPVLEPMWSTADHHDLGETDFH